MLLSPMSGSQSIKELGFDATLSLDLGYFKEYTIHRNSPNMQGPTPKQRLMYTQGTLSEGHLLVYAVLSQYVMPFEISQVLGHLRRWMTSSHIFNTCNPPVGQPATRPPDKA